MGGVELGMQISLSLGNLSNKNQRSERRGLIYRLLGAAQLGGGGILPILVESPLALLANVLHPDGLERAQAARRLNVAHHTDAHERRRL